MFSSSPFLKGLYLMKLTILDSYPGRNDKALLKIDDAQIIYRDFSGNKTKFSNGKRSFSLLIDDPSIADALEEAGYSVKRPNNANMDDGRELPTHMKIKVKYNANGPDIYLVTNGIMTKVPEERVEDLDRIRIVAVDMDVRAYDGEYGGKPFRSAYLNSMRIYQQVDRFMAEYQSQQNANSEEIPF